MFLVTKILSEPVLGALPVLQLPPFVQLPPEVVVTFPEKPPSVQKLKQAKRILCKEIAA
jgi:hypothetical protein